MADQTDLTLSTTGQALRDYVVGTENRVTALEAKSQASGSAAIFTTQAEAQAYESANPGKTGYWIDGGTVSSGGGTTTTSVAATAPTADDSTNTYTIPTKTGVQYLVGGSVKSAGTYSVGDVDTTVTVTAQATSGYTLTGTSQWTFTFTKAASAVPSGQYVTAANALAPTMYWPLDDSAAPPRNLGSNTTQTWAANNTVQWGQAGIGDGATAVTFGSTGYLSSGTNVLSGYGPNSSGTSIAALIKPATTSCGIFVDGAIEVAVVNGKLTAKITNVTVTSTGQTLTAGTRYCVGWTMTDTKVDFYVNGVLDSTVAYTLGSPGTSNPRIGLGVGQYANATLAGLVVKQGAAWTQAQHDSLANAAGL